MKKGINTAGITAVIAGVIAVGGYMIVSKSQPGIEPFDMIDGVYYGMTHDEVEAALGVQESSISKMLIMSGYEAGGFESHTTYDKAYYKIDNYEYGISYYDDGTVATMDRVTDCAEYDAQMCKAKYDEYYALFSYIYGEPTKSTFDGTWENFNTMGGATCAAVMIWEDEETTAYIMFGGVTFHMSRGIKTPDEYVAE